MQDKFIVKKALIKSLQLPYIMLFSFFINMLMLAPTGYMLQVYDRVVNSRNHETLAMLTVLVFGLYVLLESLEWVRVKLLQDAALRLDKELREQVFHAVFAGRKERTSLPFHRAFEDLRILRDSMSSSGLISVVDCPLALTILILLFLIHPRIGWFAVLGIVIQLIIAFFNQ